MHLGGQRRNDATSCLPEAVRVHSAFVQFVGDSWGDENSLDGAGEDEAVRRQGIVEGPDADAGRF